MCTPSLSISSPPPPVPSQFDQLPLYSCCTMFAASDQMLLQCPPRPLVVERRWQSNAEVAPNCPRCASPNTKFCYYNNYSFSQPRYFCKGCRRYWTKGGSLRNVPVGGGCRKSRRSKATVRPSQNDRASGGFASFGGSSTSPGLPDPSSEEERENGSAGSDIDLAAVFAKFLNQDSSGAGGGDAEAEPAGSDFSNGSNAFVGFPGYSNPDSQLEDLMFECQMPSVLVTQEADQLLAGGDGSQREVRMQGASGHDPTDFGLETVLIDDLAGDEVLWSDSDQTNIPNFTWEQEFGSFSPDDQSKFSANIITENWSLFDLSSYEIFSTP